MREIGIYVHIPFCKQKCYYCDFKSYANKEELIEKYIKWLKYEIKEVGEGNKLDYENDLDELVTVKTIYIGGGTPSYLDSKYIKEIIEEIRENFKLADKVEITIEVNPGTVNKTKLLDYINSGINRISIGLQSTDNELLKRIGRIHKYEDFLQTYNMAREVGFKNINVDLMLALPGQTIAKLEKGLKQVIDLQPEHISLYSLIIEDGTKIEKMLKNNEITLPDENIERKMYWETKKVLEEAGYIHYEISNFAKEGYKSEHNWNCWSQKEYMGFGVAAHSYTNDVRFSNIDSIEEYIENYEQGNVTDNFVFHEKQTQSSKMKEYMMLGLRKIEGISIQEFKNKFVGNPLYIYRKELQKLVEEELIEIELDKIKLTKKGLDFANIVWEEFI
ncbi:MAG: radical SAM family heme chaperone HemW [Clostridia bacterium]|jgi:oxygen-independent coproporphyrinogen-3 oxidase|nr:oxygen-independent coproporphyrinogen III oxidase [Clostridium sp. CAG:798]HBJ12297.1 oxygen-independent coproporphyrinogen III oxidase [Clostridiales bacterium]